MEELLIFNIAFEYENLGDYKLAIHYLEKVLRFNPDNEPSIYEISFCFEINNATEKGIEFFTKFLDKHPYSKSAWFMPSRKANSETLCRVPK